MKRLIVYTMMVGISFFLFGQEQRRKLNIHHLEDDFYLFQTFNSFKGKLYSANGMYLVTEKGAVLFDAPWDTTWFQPLLDSIRVKHGKEVYMYLSTHSHDDRAGGVEYYRGKGIKTYSTRKTDKILSEKGKSRAEFLFESDTTFKVGDYTFNVVYPGHGHTIDNIVVWFEKEQILYGGCFVKSTKAYNMGYVGEADIYKWEKGVKRLKRKVGKPKYIIPGHGDWKDTRSLERTLELIKEYKEDIK